MIEIPKTDRKLVVPVASSSYPELGIYGHGEYKIKNTLHFTRTPDMSYYQIKGQLPAGYRMSTAGEELDIELDLKRIFKDLSKEKIFDEPPINEYCAGYRMGLYIWQCTETFLRVPKGKQNPDKPDYTDSRGRKYWAREFGNGNGVIGVVYVPEGNGRIVPKTNDTFDVWDRVTGLPRVTSDSDIDKNRKYDSVRFFFNVTPNKDDTSGHCDVSVGRRGNWLHGFVDDFLEVDANNERLTSCLIQGFRPVQGPLPDIIKIA